MIFILIAYFLLSHLILDLAYSGIALLYPIAPERFYFSIDFVFEDWKITPVIDYGKYYIEPAFRSPEGEFISNISIMLFILISLFIAAQILLKRKIK